MKSQLRMLATLFGCSILMVACAPRLNAQIMNAIEAHLDHSFLIGNTTLPPGDYTFRMMHGSDLQLMTATSANDKTTVEFIVREAINDHTPNHSVLIFRKYGTTEFLEKIFQAGSKVGVRIDEPSRQQARLVKEGQQGVEHGEEQK